MQFHQHFDFFHLILKLEKGPKYLKLFFTLNFIQKHLKKNFASIIMLVYFFALNQKFIHYIFPYKNNLHLHFKISLFPLLFLLVYVNMLLVLFLYFHFLYFPSLYEFFHNLFIHKQILYHYNLLIHSPHFNKQIFYRLLLNYHFHRKHYHIKKVCVEHFHNRHEIKHFFQFY